MAIDPTLKGDLHIRAGLVFTPASPIHEKDVFAGRSDQITTIIDAISQRGKHVIIYGERGVGKTSLAMVLSEFLRSVVRVPVVAPHVNCTTQDGFSNMWKRVFKQVLLVEKQKSFGFNRELTEQVTLASNSVSGDITPDDVLTLSASVAESARFIPIIDEFDRLNDRSCTRQLTDTIKAMSDHAPWTSVVLVGVADTVEELIAEHASIERSMVQVRMPRMSSEELKEIVRSRAQMISMTVDDLAAGYIAWLSRGLPHYTHLLGLNSAREALARDSLAITDSSVDGAIKKIVKDSQHSLLNAYHAAVSGQRKGTLYGAVLLAAALADTDNLGYFSASDVREPMTRIMGKLYDIPAFSRHLKDFCKAERGPALEKTGVERRYRFRFKNPLLQPFVIMRGLADGTIRRDDVWSKPAP